MSIILSLLLFMPSVALAEEKSQCAEIAAVMQEAVRRGDITYREAGEIVGRCFNANW